MIKTRLKGIYCAQSQKIDDGKRKVYMSSYKKTSLDKEEFYVDAEGLIDDTQSDKEHHGGVDKAVCVYSRKYYNYLEAKYNLELPECAFGENLTILDLDDSEVCLGDRFQCGEVIFEVSQPRQPCWKISSVIGIKSLTSLIVKEAKTGFYFRVLKTGIIRRSDELKLILRVHPKFTIEFLNHCSFDAKNHQEDIQEILQVSSLSKAFYISLLKRVTNKEYGLQEWQSDDY